MKPLKYWIKQRYNPQLGTYYITMGQLTAKDAKAHEKTIFGHNTMHRFDSHEKYQDEIEKLQAAGERVQ